MDPDPRPCLRCGAPAKVRYKTVMRGEIRVPVDPYVACENGHVAQPPRMSRAADVRRPDEGPGTIA